ncbi:MAG TPA: SRPBCC family protein [Solirubrobacteraceae bacterium]|nr:SRPBCC family protein [Solirubrobacteraceae bacterium]
MTQSLDERPSPQICWPVGFAPSDADLFARNHIWIAASTATVWHHLVEAPKWPDWYPNAHNVRVTTGNDRSELAPGAGFEFDTFTLHVNAIVGEFDPPHQLGWFGTAPDFTTFHAWLLSATAGGCQVVTEEAARGKAAIAFKSPDPLAMQKGHQIWLETLKEIAERGSPGDGSDSPAGTAMSSR